MTAFYQSRSLPKDIQSLFDKIITEMTEHQNNQQIYLSERKLFSSILDNINDGILVVNEKGFVTLINQAALRLFDLSGFLPGVQSLAELLRNHKVNELFENVQISKKQEIGSFEITSGRAFIQVIASPLEPELPDHILFLFHDLTRIRQLEIVRRDFVSDVSHELRTPLASLKLITETLQEGAIKDPIAAETFLTKMDGEVDNLTQLVEELLELSRIEYGRVPLNKNWIKPQSIIASACERMALQAKRAGISLKHKVDISIPDIYADEQRLEQVILNLLHNAIKFTNPGGEVFVSAVKDGNAVTFSIKDSGIGIPPKDLERIFERFYKTDRSRTKQGTGLGLSISRHLVESHNGKIWAESQINIGSTFFFSIPIQ